MKRKNACVVVLGDIGRSPRMQYHAISLAKAGYFVDVIGYNGSAPLSELLFSPNVNLHYISQFPTSLSWVQKYVLYFLKVVWQTCVLLWNLCTTPAPIFYLVQNPPSIPTLPICWLVAKARRAQLIIDWHNYGYTILGLSLGSEHSLVRIHKVIEGLHGRFANVNFCVTKAMKRDLLENLRIRADTLYDKPHEMFKAITLSEKHELFLKLARDHHQFSSSRPDDTLFTERFADGKVRLRTDRPGFLVSSTSWTEDEDFSILLDALDVYELKRSLNSMDYPPLICVITGKGPLKDYYCDLITSKQWQHIEVCTPWLDPEDYPKILASADLGVSLHTSSSGLDLPMKIVDMFGCGLPVCAVKYDCLSELVVHGKNGMMFTNSGQLADELLNWFRGFPRDNQSQRQRFKSMLSNYQNYRWQEEWDKVVLPTLLAIK